MFSEGKEKTKRTLQLKLIMYINNFNLHYLSTAKVGVPARFSFHLDKPPLVAVVHSELLKDAPNSSVAEPRLIDARTQPLSS